MGTSFSTHRDDLREKEKTLVDVLSFVYTVLHGGHHTPRGVTEIMRE